MRASGQGGFRVRHPADRYAFAAMVALIRVVILMRFVADVIHKVSTHGLDFRLAVDPMRLSVSPGSGC